MQKLQDKRGTFIKLLSYKNPLVKEALNQGEICYAFTLQSKNYLFLIAAWAAARRAIGTRKGEQDT